jgi:regulator of replication initiation timing
MMCWFSRFTCCVSLCLLMAGTVRAEVEWEDFQRLNARVTAHDESIEIFRQTLQRLEREIRDLKVENERLRQELKAKPEGVTLEQLNKVADQVREVDKKRVSDNQVFVEAMAKLEKLVVSTPPPVAPTKPVEPSPSATGNVSGDERTDGSASAGYYHTVRPGQSIGSILDAYKKEYGLKTTLEDIRKANPKIRNLNLVQVGQEIVIPVIR